MSVVAGILAAADDIDGMATLSDFAAVQADREGDGTNADLNRRVAIALRASARLLRARASAEVTDKFNLCTMCRRRLDGEG